MALEERLEELGCLWRLFEVVSFLACGSAMSRGMMR